MTFETPLLYEQSTPGLSGVDVPNAPAFIPRTGQPLRQHIGLPEVTEPQVVRHYTRLSQQNYSIDTTFYPLGSCTMKHNPRLNEQVARLPGFAQVHPLQPKSSLQGIIRLGLELQHWLATLTGLPGITLAPAAGAHGELTGMLVIRQAHLAKGDARQVVLIPDSAHGTNPATAATCGYRTVPVATGADGRVDLSSFKAALAEHGTTVAAFMLTNPNTCGLFERDVQTMASLLHEVGAYFYADGANFNAIVGKVRPADLGVDVMQFNLHKTFSTPHGGGGPGCGPVAVCADLLPYLPVPHFTPGQPGETRSNPTGGSIVWQTPDSIGQVKGFYGHVGIWVRALAYMLSHGANGLQQVAEDAVLNANYLLHKLKDDFHVPYPGTCMHECLLTDKHQKARGSSTLDIAKALLDKGFHPMTMYFPLVVHGAMLIEPTESESQATLDAFAAAMKEIAQEIQKGNTFADAPETTPRRRADETLAARQPCLNWADFTAQNFEK